VPREKNVNQGGEITRSGTAALKPQGEEKRGRGIRGGGVVAGESFPGVGQTKKPNWKRSTGLDVEGEETCLQKAATGQRGDAGAGAKASPGARKQKKGSATKKSSLIGAPVEGSVF